MVGGSAAEGGDGRRRALHVLVHALRARERAPCAPPPRDGGESLPLTPMPMLRLFGSL